MKIISSNTAKVKHLFLLLLLVATETAAQTVGTVWQCNHSQYSYSSTFYLTLTENGSIIDGARMRDFEIGAFVCDGKQEECRGIATYAKLYQEGALPVYAFRVWRKTSSETFSLRLLNTRTAETVNLSPTSASGTKQTLTTSRLFFGSQTDPLRASITLSRADATTSRSVTGTLWQCPVGIYQKDVQAYFTIQLPADLQRTGRIHPSCHSR